MYIWKLYVSAGPWQTRSKFWWHITHLTSALLCVQKWLRIQDLNCWESTSSALMLLTRWRKGSLKLVLLRLLKFTFWQPWPNPEQLQKTWPVKQESKAAISRKYQRSVCWWPVHCVDRRPCEPPVSGQDSISSLFRSESRSSCPSCSASSPPLSSQSLTHCLTHLTTHQLFITHLMCNLFHK